jgi:pseudouridine-5'-phosphate glycosidase
MTMRPSSPRVALESTLVAHGLPYPDNLEVGRALEAAVRDAGATPATIAVIDGEARVGLTGDELERIARGGRDIAKAGVADLAAVMARGGTAATTVSATSALAHRAGIRVFATGGIGGVHPATGGDRSWDVSSDLATLARTPIAVVSAGAKAVLDLPATMEALESLGVLVVGYQTDELPAFYTRESGIGLEHRADDPAALARILHQRFDVLGLGGVLIANPIPADAALDPREINAVIDAARADAEAAGVRGKAVTPQLLARIAEATGGRAVAANRALALANARLAAELAVCYAELAG